MKESILGSPVDLEGILAAIPDHMCVIDREYNVIRANDIAIKTFGTDVRGQKCYMVYHGHKKPCRSCGLEKTFQDGKSYEHETKVINASGEVRIFWCKTGVFRRDENGKPLHVVELSRDVTERRNSEKTLAESEEKYRSLTENTADMIMRFDSDLRYMYVNPAVEKRFGIPADQIIGRTDKELGFTGNVHNMLAEKSLEVFKSGVASEVQFQNEINGVAKVWSTLLMPEADRNGNVKSILATSRDISELEAARRETDEYREQLVQAQKMEAVGQLAGGVAHDFNNMLSVIIGYTFMAIEKLAGNKAVEDLKLVMDAARRSRELTVKLLTFSRSQKTDPIAITASRLMKNLKLMFEPGAQQKIRLLLDLKKDMLLHVDENQVHQALLNICNNSRDSMPGGGTIKVEIVAEEFTQQPCIICGQEFSGPFCRIRIEDEGTGIPVDLIDKVFDPFFTTKGLGKGTGLGLSTTMGIIKSHGGHLQIESPPGEGTAISVFLPINADILCETEVAEEKYEMQQQRSGTILVIDDEIQLLKMVKRILETVGYKVHIADSGLHGVKMFRELQGELDLVLLDMLMPVMDGEEVFDEIKKIDPDIKIAVMTGFSPTERTQGLMQRGAVTAISKPFLPAELYKSIDAALKQ